jgi:hypothetical protein
VFDSPAIVGMSDWMNQILNHPFFPFYVIICVLIIIGFLAIKELNYQLLLKSVNKWMIDEKERIGFKRFKFFFSIAIFCFILIVMFFLMLIPLNTQQTNSNALNDYFSIKYQNEIQPQSELEINRIVNEVKSISNISEKLERIAEWETKNFTDIYWHHVAMKSLNPYVNTYIYESNGKIRAARSFVSTPYAEDPDWIQYYKFGACGEEAALFANVTNRTGLVTRFVVLDLGSWYKGIPLQTGNHVFVEVEVNKNDWYFFDPTVYGADHILNESSCKDGKTCDNRWFGKPDQYNYFSPDQVLRVYLRETNEDISERYSKISVYIKNSKMPMRINRENITIPQSFNLTIFD